MNKFCFLLIFLIIPTMIFAQSRRVTPNVSTATASADSVKTSAELYDDANTYAKRRFDEFERKQIPFSATLEKQTFLEQKQLAARYATQIAARNNLKADDFYNLALLHVLAENTDGAVETMQNFLSFENNDVEKSQTGRAVLVVTLARKKNFAEAENFLAEYEKNSPLRPKEQAKMERELAQNYQFSNNLESALKHASAAFKISQTFVQNPPVAPQTRKEIFTDGMNLYKIQAELKQDKDALATLDDLKQLGISTQSTGIYTETVGEMAAFLVGNGEKPRALKFIASETDSINTNFRGRDLRETVSAALSRNAKQMLLLNEIAPELVLDRWIGANPMTFADLRGKVVLLDFWASWCAPCFAEFPHLSEWHKTYKNEGLVIIGVTRYYGQANGFSVDENAESQFLTNLKAQNRLPYPFAVAKTNDNHKNYVASSIPTAVLIDRQGKVRYIKTGSGGTEEETEKIIRKLLAEKQ